MRPKGLPAVGLAMALATVVADQLVKGWAHAWVGLHGPIPLFTGLNIVAWNNTGTAFGIGQGASRWVLVAVAVAISAWLLLWLLRTRRPVEAFGLGLAIGGALSNVIDRVRLGSVRDFIDLYWREHHWPAFNLADAAIVVGLAMVILFNQEPKGQRKRSSDGIANHDRESR